MLSDVLKDMIRSDVQTLTMSAVVVGPPSGWRP